MTDLRSRGIAALVVASLIAGIAPADGQSPGAQPSFRSATELVLVNVVVRDKDGIVRDLRREDFTVLEDGKPQTVQSFDFEDLESSGRVGAEAVSLLSGKVTSPPPAAGTPALAPAPAGVDVSGRRL